MTPSLKIPLALSLLLALHLSAHATLVIGSEKGVTTPTPDVAPFSQDNGQLATDGDTFLAVWIDQTLTGIGDVHAARVSSTGKRIDDDVLRIAVTDTFENWVAVAYGSDRYLVVWPTLAAIHARFVGRDGSMSDVIDINSILGESTQPQVAFNGNRFLLIWRAGTVYRGATIDPNGQVLKTFDVASSAQTWAETALVTVNGAFQFVTAITDFNGAPNGNGYPASVGFTTIDENGAVSERVVVAPATTPVFDVRAVSSGSDFLMAWSTALGIPGGMVRAARVTSTGPGAIESIPAEGAWLHDVAVDGAGFLIIYGAEGAKSIRRLGASAPSGVVATPDTPTAILDAAGNGARTLALVRGNARVGLYGPAGADLYITRLDTQEIEPLVVAPRHQSSPDLAAAGDVRLAVWCEYIGSDRRLGIVASRLDADSNGIDLGADVDHPAEPRVASNGTDWLVAWIDGTTVFGSRVAHDGTRLDASPFVIASGIYESSHLAVSWDGTQYIVVYLRGQSVRGLRTTLRAARVTSQGTLSLPELTLSTEAENEFPAISSQPTGSLIVWRSGFFLQGVLLSSGGTTTPLAFPSTYPVGPRPAVAWNSGTFIVAAPVRGPFGDQIHWQLVSAAGVVQTPLSTFVDINGTQIISGGYPVELEPYGDTFLLFWTGLAVDAEQRTVNVFAARINGTGLLVDAPKNVLTTSFDYIPSIGASGNTIVYSRKIGHATRELARVYTRTVQYSPGKPRRRAVR